MAATEGVMVVSGADVGAVIKVGTSIAQGLKQADAPAKWPNAHEALMELFVIIDDWCEAARSSNEVARRKVAMRMAGVGAGARISISGNTLPRTHVAGITFKDYIRRVLKDIDSVMISELPWFQRWRGSRRRSIGRRTLRSMLRIYEPALLDAFERSVEGRAAWVTAHRNDFDYLFGSQRPVEDLQESLKQMEKTLKALESVREQLKTLISEKYPMGSL